MLLVIPGPRGFEDEQCASGSGRENSNGCKVSNGLFSD